jgi:aerobic carbon-monoxide dehydrogenase medium subunit
MASTPLRAHVVEAALAGIDASAEPIKVASGQASLGTNAPSDLAGHADYRNHLAAVLTHRAVCAAAGV